MCTTCGCGQGETTVDGKVLHQHDHDRSHDHGHDHAHDHGHDHVHAHAHAHGHDHGHHHSHDPETPPERIVRIEQDVLAKNDAHAAANRATFAARGVFALNLVSSPGSGKTTLLVRTVKDLMERVPCAVVEGDQQTDTDADRIKETGAEVVQINTGKGCHLDAHMVGHAFEDLETEKDSLLFIENVGNLVCPAAFDLGEAHKVVVLSVTEGDDKPLKYPDMFAAADLLLLNKIDLLPHVDFDVDRCIEYARRVRPDLEVMQVSARTCKGMPAWYEWILARHRDTVDRRRAGPAY